MDKIRLFFIDGSMVALMYYGLFVGNEYAANVFWPVFWVFIFLSFFVLVAFINKEARKEVMKNRKPNPKWKEKYSFVYDLLFSLSLAALGFGWAGGIWFIVSLTAGSVVREADESLRSEAKKEAE